MRKANRPGLDLTGLMADSWPDRHGRRAESTCVYQTPTADPFMGATPDTAQRRRAGSRPSRTTRSLRSQGHGPAAPNHGAVVPATGVTTARCPISTQTAAARSDPGQLQSVVKQTWAHSCPIQRFREKLRSVEAQSGFTGTLAT